MENVTTNEWNENQDAGYPLHKATKELVAKHPEWEPEIKAYYGRWLEMLGDQIMKQLRYFSNFRKQKNIKFMHLPTGALKLFRMHWNDLNFLKCLAALW